MACSRRPLGSCARLHWRVRHLQHVHEGTAGRLLLELDREFKNYRVQDCSGRRNVVAGVGVLEGVVTDIGWNDRAIVAKRIASIGGDASGWMVIDVSTDKIEGAFSDQAFREKLASESRLQGIEPKAVERILK
jgi:hypothetical protein